MPGQDRAGTGQSVNLTLATDSSTLSSIRWAFWLREERSHPLYA